jgi:hypothetical protein
MRVSAFCTSGVERARTVYRYGGWNGDAVFAVARLGVPLTHTSQLQQFEGV